jgi:hypothetical protein
MSSTIEEPTHSGKRKGEESAEKHTKNSGFESKSYI